MRWPALALLIAVCFAARPAEAERPAAPRAAYGPSANAILRSQPGAPPSIAVTATHERRATAQSRDLTQHLSRIPGDPAASYRGAHLGRRERNARRIGARLRGVAQTVRPTANGGVLRTRLSEGAIRRHPSLAVALRRFADAVLVEHHGGRYVLHGPVVAEADGRSAYLRIEVMRDGRTWVTTRDAVTDAPRAGTRALASRDFSRHPVVVRSRTLPRDLYAISDVHGDAVGLAEVLHRHGLVSDARIVAPRWTAGAATLVLVGDAINKGPASIATIDFLRSLEDSAAAAGGRLIVTLGNHETVFLADPRERRFDRPDRLVGELARAGIRAEDMSHGRDAEGRGEWLRSRPLAAHLGDLLFIHAGDTRGRSVGEIADEGRVAIERHGFHAAIVSGVKTERRSVVGSSDWESEGHVRANLRALRRGAQPVRRIVYGHNELALRQAAGEIVEGFGHQLTNLDTGFFRNQNPRGGMLHIETTGGTSRATALYRDGTRTPLW